MDRVERKEGSREGKKEGERSGDILITTQDSPEQHTALLKRQEKKAQYNWGKRLCQKALTK